MEKAKIEKSKRIISQYKRVFSTAEGRAVLHDLVKSNFMISSTPFVAGDPYFTHVNIGKQQVVMGILHILKVDPEKFFAIAEGDEGNHV